MSSLCSGFSFCISLLDKIWVWHGRGSVVSQREAAMKYARALLIDAKSIVEMEEGKEDQLFFMFLGKDDYACADYWRWKTEDLPENEVRIWEIRTFDNDLKV